MQGCVAQSLHKLFCVCVAFLKIVILNFCFYATNNIIYKYVNSYYYKL